MAKLTPQRRRVEADLLPEVTFIHELNMRFWPTLFQLCYAMISLRFKSFLCYDSSTFIINDALMRILSSYVISLAPGIDFSTRMLTRVSVNNPQIDG